MVLFPVNVVDATGVNAVVGSRLYCHVAVRAEYAAATVAVIYWYFAVMNGRGRWNFRCQGTSLR